MAQRWAGFASRSAQKAALNLGVIAGPALASDAHKRFRSPKLEALDAYYENRQYAHLTPWDEASTAQEGYVPIRARQPRLKYAFAKMLCQRVASKLVGLDTFPSFLVEDDPDTQTFLRLVSKLAKLQGELIEPVRRTLAAGASLVRFHFIEGSVKIESYLSKYCYPEFNPQGELSSVRIQYVFADPTEKDEKGKPIEKWYKLELGEVADVLFDNPRFEPNSEPIFTEVSRAEHGLGFVQAVWIRTSKNKHDPDGPSLIEDITGFIDEICYSLSQSSQAVGYNQDPQLTFTGMDGEELDTLIRSASKAWNLGREAEAKFLESTLTGVERASELRDKVKLGIQDISRVVMLDPEKFAAQAQSGRAMESLHGPLVELINELRPAIEESLTTLLLKIALVVLILEARGIDTGIDMPPGWSPKSLNLTVQWPPIFPLTMFDLKEKVGVAVAVTSANIISRETMTRWLAKDFSVEDIEEEIAKIAAQPVLNPFGGF